MANGISFKVDEELLRDIHIRAAREGGSIQQYMNTLIERDLFPERFPQLTGEQTNHIKAELEMAVQALSGVEALAELVVRLGGKPTLPQCVDKLHRMCLFPEQFPQLTEEQTEQLRDAMETIDLAIEDVNDILWDHPEQNVSPPAMKLGG